MKRTPLKRKTRLQARTPLKASKPLARSTGTRNKTARSQQTHSGFSAEVRQQALARDGGCVARSVWPLVRCGGWLHIHHVMLRSQGGPHTLENALVLCDTHHRIAHDVDRAGAEAAGIIKRASQTG